MKKKLDELHRIDVETFRKKYEQSSVVVLDNIRSGHNVGSIFRTSDCFGIGKIYLCGITARVDNRELQKAAIGAEMSVASHYYADVVECIKMLKGEGFKIISLEQTHRSTPLESMIFDSQEKYAFVLGNEVDGVSDSVLEQSDRITEIPQIGTKHSLNVSNAASILLWDFFNKTTL